MLCRERGQQGLTGDRGIMGPGICSSGTSLLFAGRNEGRKEDREEGLSLHFFERGKHGKYSRMQAKVAGTDKFTQWPSSHRRDFPLSTLMWQFNKQCWKNAALNTCISTTYILTINALLSRLCVCVFTQAFPDHHQVILRWGALSKLQTSFYSS